MEVVQIFLVFGKYCNGDFYRYSFILGEYPLGALWTPNVDSH